MIGSAGDSLISLVCGRKAKPRMAMRTPVSWGKCFFNSFRTCRGCCSLMRRTDSSSCMGCPTRAPWAISAFTSFGRQLPPKPHPAQRKEAIGAVTQSPPGSSAVRYLLRWSPLITSTMSTPPRAAQRLPSSLENEIIVASRQLDAYLIISAVFGLHRTRCASGNAAYSSSSRPMLFSSIPPSTMRSGNMKSWTASPSVRNSGFIATPKSRRLFAGGLFQQWKYGSLGRPGDHRAFHDDQVIAVFLVERAPDLPGRLLDVAQVDLTIRRGGSHGNERQLGLQHRTTKIGGRAQPFPGVLL